MSLTKEIQKAVGISCLNRLHSLVIENISLMHCHINICSKEVDVLSINKDGAIFEYEVKISRSDYYADLKKFKHDYFRRGSEYSPNYFSYVCPKDLILKSEIPDYAGLYYYENENIIEIKRPKRITDTNHNIEAIRRKFISVMSERAFYGEARLTRKNRQNTEGNFQSLRNHIVNLENEIKQLQQENETLQNLFNQI
jgi:hypothetical protein